MSFIQKQKLLVTFITILFSVLPYRIVALRYLNIGIKLLFIIKQQVKSYQKFRTQHQTFFYSLFLTVVYCRMLSLLHRVKVTQSMKFCLKQQERIVTLFIEQEGNYLTSG